MKIRNVPAGRAAAPAVRVGRKYRFSAAHRMYTEGLSESENARRYGKCANPAGHGHNYIVTVIAEGTPDPITSLVVTPEALDAAVHPILAEVDNTYLDKQVEPFRSGTMSSTENVIQFLASRFAPALRKIKGHDVRLSRIELVETRNNLFEWEAV